MQTEPISDYEKERGKPMPSKLHSVVQTNLTVLLSGHPPYSVLSELTLELEGRELTPDLSVYEHLDVDFTEDELRMTDPPLLTVEIASPTQGIQELIDKIRFLLGAGVQSGWLVQPQLRTITVYGEGMASKTYSEGTVADPNLDVEVEIADVFTAP